MNSPQETLLSVGEYHLSKTLSKQNQLSPLPLLPDFSKLEEKFDNLLAKTGSLRLDQNMNLIPSPTHFELPSKYCRTHGKSSSGSEGSRNKKKEKKKYRSRSRSKSQRRLRDSSRERSSQLKSSYRQDKTSSNSLSHSMLRDSKKGAKWRKLEDLQNDLLFIDALDFRKNLCLMAKINDDFDQEQPLENYYILFTFLWENRPFLQVEKDKDNLNYEWSSNSKEVCHENTKNIYWIFKSFSKLENFCREFAIRAKIAREDFRRYQDLLIDLEEKISNVFQKLKPFQQIKGLKVDFQESDCGNERKRIAALLNNTPNEATVFENEIISVEILDLWKRKVGLAIETSLERLMNYPKPKISENLDFSKVLEALGNEKIYRINWFIVKKLQKKFEKYLEKKNSIRTDFQKIQDEKFLENIRNANIVTANLKISFNFPGDEPLYIPIHRFSESLQIFEMLPDHCRLYIVNQLKNEMLMIASQTKQAIEELTEEKFFTNHSEKTLMGYFLGNIIYFFDEIKKSKGNIDPAQIKYLSLELFSTRDSCASCSTLLSHDFQEIFAFFMIYFGATKTISRQSIFKNLSFMIPDPDSYSKSQQNSGSFSKDDKNYKDFFQTNFLLRFIHYQKLPNQGFFPRTYFLSTPSVFVEDKWQFYEKHILPLEKKLADFLNESSSLDKSRVYDENSIRVAKIKKAFSSFVKETNVNMIEEPSKLKLVAKTYGFECFDVPHDGNCLFNAISHQLSINDQHFLAKNLRRKAISELCTHPDKYQSFILDNESLDDYILKNIQNKSWLHMNEILVIALVRALNINLIILHDDGRKPIVYKRPNYNGEVIYYLGHELDWHFQSLIKKEEESSAFNELKALFEITNCFT